MWVGYSDNPNIKVTWPGKLATQGEGKLVAQGTVSFS
jgi:hypothetical protein